MHAESRTSSYILDCNLIKRGYPLDILKEAYLCVFLTIYATNGRQPLKAQWLLYVPPGVTFKYLYSAHRVYIRVSHLT